MRHSSLFLFILWIHDLSSLHIKSNFFPKHGSRESQNKLRTLAVFNVVYASRSRVGQQYPLSNVPGKLGNSCVNLPPRRFVRLFRDVSFPTDRVVQTYRIEKIYRVGNPKTGDMSDLMIPIIAIVGLTSNGCGILRQADVRRQKMQRSGASSMPGHRKTVSGLSLEKHGD